MEIRAPRGPLSRAHRATFWLTWVQPLGAGEWSASLISSYQAAGVRGLTAAHAFATLPNLALGDPVLNPINPATGKPINPYSTAIPVPTYVRYYSQEGAFREEGVDTYTWDLKLQWQIPLAFRERVRLIGSLQVSDLFNHLRRRTYGIGAPIAYNGTGYVRDRLLRNLTVGTGWGDTLPGTAAESTYYTGAARTVGEFSIGLKF